MRLTESEKTELSYLLVSLLRLHDKAKRGKMLDLIEKFNGPFSENVAEVVALVCTAMNHLEEG